MAVPAFLIWHCAGCGAAAKGKEKPCGCTTNVGTRKGPRGGKETTWWDDPLVEKAREILADYEAGRPLQVKGHGWLVRFAHALAGEGRQ